MLFWQLYAVVLFSGVDISLARAGHLPLGALVIQVAAAAAAVFFLRRADFGPHVKAGFWLIATFCGAAAFALMMNGGEIELLDAPIVVAPLVSYVLWMFIHPKVSAGWAWVALLSMAALAISTAIDLYFPGTFTRVMYRPAGFPSNPNTTAFFAVALLALLLWSHVPQWIKYACLGLAGFVVALSASRFGLVSMLVVVGVFALTSGRLRNTIPGLLLAGLGVLAFTLMRDNSFLTESTVLASRYDLSTAINQAFEERAKVNADYIAGLDRCAWIGCGVAEYNIQTVHAHNTFLNTVFKAGIVGLVSLALFWGLVVYSAVRSGNVGYMLTAMVLVAGLFVHNDTFIYPVAIAAALSIFLASDAREPKKRPVERKVEAEPRLAGWRGFSDRQGA